MTTKVTTTKTENTYSLVLTREDIIAMLEDSDVGFAVDDDQEISVVYQKNNGTETNLKTLAGNDRLVLRFTSSVIVTSDVPLGIVDIQP